MNDATLNELTAKYPDRVRAILNILVETPYFYRTDNEDLYFFLRRHRSEFARFGETYFGWHLFMDAKCARFYKDQWHNEAVSETNRDMFDFRTRDECLGFMILLEFFEHLLEENAMTVEDAENPRFLFGDFLVYTQRRFVELFPAEAQTRYTQEHVRSRILRRILPVLEKYRLLQRLRPPVDQDVKESDTIFEAMPALYHYNAGMLSRFVAEAAPRGEEGVSEAPQAPLAEGANLHNSLSDPPPADEPAVENALLSPEGSSPEQVSHD